MTALERAKAFVNSRAAKTALRIMPLALATVVAVSDVPKAHASPTALSGSFSQWQYKNCSSGAPCMSGLGGGTNSNPSPSSTFVAYGSEGIQGKGDFSAILSGQKLPPNSPQALVTKYNIAGSGMGTYGTQALFGWAFDVSCTHGTSACDPTDVFSYTVTATIDGNTVPLVPGTLGGPFVPGTAVSSSVLIPTNAGDSIPADQWSAEIDFTWTGQTGEVIDFNPVLTLDPNPAPPGVPEPASLLLALSGLPLIGRFYRRKR